MPIEMSNVAYNRMFGPGGVGTDPGAIEMSNAAYNRMFSAAKGYPQRSPVTAGMPTPGNLIQSRLALSKRQLQDKVNYQRGQIIKQGKVKKLDNKQINTYIRKLYANADQKMMELTQEAETQTASLVELDQFGRIGGVSQDALTRAKWRMMGGPEAGRMLQVPKPEAAKDPVKEYGALDIHRNRLEKRAEGYRWSGTPGKAKLEVWNPWKEKWTTEKTPEQLEDAIALKNEIAKVHQMQQTILRGSDFAMRGTALKSRRMVGGPLGGQIADYIERKQGPQEPEDLSKMSDEELQRIIEGR